MAAHHLKRLLATSVLVLLTASASAQSTDGYTALFPERGPAIPAHSRQRPAPALSQARPDAQPAAPVRQRAHEADLVEHGNYRNSDGVSVHAPAHTVSGAVPAGASARCGDGSYSFSLHRRGTCSHHGGVSSWL